MTHLRAPKRRNMGVQVMGVVNVTPDSFSDGGDYLDPNAARRRIEQCISQGAAIIDLGAESTRPGAPQVSPIEQFARLGSLVAFTVARGAIASVDTTSPEVAAWALEQGARIINSVSLETAGELGRLAARHGADLVLTHCRGSMTNMGGFSHYSDHAYDDIVVDVVREWSAAAATAESSGLASDAIIFDPGLGYTKNARQSLELCVRLDELKEALGRRVLVGTSRKSYIAATVARGDTPYPGPNERLGGTIAATLDCVRRGADIVRVHDVGEVSQALAYASASMQLEAEVRSA